MNYLGIDFGSHAARMARIDSDGVAALVPDYRQVDRYETCSLVHVGTDCALVGQVAEHALLESPDLPVARAVGERLGTGDVAHVDGRGRAWEATALAALLLRKLARDALSLNDGRLPRPAIAAPARYGADQHDALREAALLAGFPDPLIVCDAAAIVAHELRSRERRAGPCLVLDIGASACSATVVDPQQKLPVSLGSAVSRDCGGSAVDRILAGLVEAACGKAFSAAELRSPNRSPLEDLKLELCSGGTVRRALLLGSGVHEVALTPRQLARSLSPLLDAYHDACERVLAQTGIAWRQLDAVILAGGSGALPGARERLLEISALPSERVRRTDPLTAASLGAALLARLDGSGAAASLLAPVARDIGILVFDPEQGRSAVHVILKRDEPLPARRSATVYTSRPNQQRITVEIVQSEGLDAEPAPLARFSLGPLPPRARNQPVELTLTCDARGQLTATARDPQTGRELAHQIDDPRQRAHARWRDLQAQIDSVRINE